MSIGFLTIWAPIGLKSDGLCGTNNQLHGMNTMTDMPETGAMDTNPPTDHVQNHVDLVIDDLVSGRTTIKQRRGLKGATERADRVAPESDAAVGRALR